MSKQQRNKFRQSFADEKARVRLYKSGKNWVKAGIKEIKLLGIMGVPFLSSSIEKQPDLSQKTDGFVKRQALKTTAVAGGIFTVNMLHDQQAFAASDAPVTSELSAHSETVGNQNSTAIGKSETNTSASEELSTSISESESASLAEQATSESTSEEEANKASTSSRADEEQSESTEASSTSERQEESESAKKETTSEQPASESSNSESTSAEQTSEKQQSSESVKEDKAEQKSTKADETSESQASQSTATSEDKASEKASTSQNAKDTSASQKAERQSTSTTESTTGKDVVSDVISFKTSTSESRGYSGFRARSAGRIALDNFARLAENGARAAADASQTQTYTGAGYDQKNVPIYYKLTTKQNGNRVDFTYTVTYDNPNTSTIERLPHSPKTTAGVNNSAKNNQPMFYLGPGFSKPYNAQTGSSDSNGNFAGGVGPNPEYIYPLRDGYYWSGNFPFGHGLLNQGYGITTKWSANIIADNATWDFVPFASSTDSNRNFFIGRGGAAPVIHGEDPSVASKSASQSIADSQSQSRASEQQSTSKKASEQQSNSKRLSEQASTSKRLSEQQSNSKRLSEQQSNSKRLSEQESNSKKASESVVRASESNSRSEDSRLSEEKSRSESTATVSYTHLTLPTICSV